MEIYFDFELSNDDYAELIDNFETIEFVENNREYEKVFSEVMVNTKDLLTEEFEDWIRYWLDAWYVLKDKDNKYMITM